MAVKYKHKCSRCKDNYVTVTYRNSYPLCYDCQKGDLKGEIKDPKIKKLLKIPEDYYKDNAFLRSIKINAIKFGKLSEKQIEAFKKAVKRYEEE
jgi:hypothetical protein